MITKSPVHKDHTQPRAHNYYAVRIGGQKVDVYRILRAYGIADPCIQHAIKKLLRCGRGVKSIEEDVEEAIATLQRWREMKKEDEG